MSQPSPSTSSTVTFDDVFKAMQHWRNHKNEYPKPGIPDDVWLMIFGLENNGYTAKDLKRLFNLNSQQYAIKQNQLAAPNNQPSSPSELKESCDSSKQSDNKVDFCEAVIESSAQDNIPSLAEAANATKKAVSQLKSTNNNSANYLDPTTIIVECLRPDGHRLKIHITSKSVNTVMEAFFGKGASS